MIKPIKLYIFILFNTVFQMSAIAQTDSSLNSWLNYITPGKTHLILSFYTGEWNLDLTTWMTNESDPQNFSLSSVNSLTLGGRFFECKQYGQMREMEYEGLIYLSFNNVSQKFTLVSFTNMGTGMLVLEGGWDKPEETIELNGEIVDPGSKNLIKVRQRISFIDKNTFLIENFDDVNNKGASKTIEYKFTRRIK